MVLVNLFRRQEHRVFYQNFDALPSGSFFAPSAFREANNIASEGRAAIAQLWSPHGVKTLDRNLLIDVFMHTTDGIN